MNLSQLVKKSNWIREFVDQTHFPLDPIAKDEFSLASYKDAILNKVSSGTTSASPVSTFAMDSNLERKHLEAKLRQLSIAVESESQKLADSLDHDATSNPKMDFISLKNLDAATPFFNSPALKEDDLGSHAGQKVLGSFFRALDSVARADIDHDSFVGNSDREIENVLEYLDALKSFFEDATVSILEKVKPETLFAISHEIRQGSERFFTDLGSVFAAAEGSHKAKSKAS